MTDEPVPDAFSAEISVPSRPVAEALRLEIRRLARALGVEITALRIARAPEED
ncbi:MAG: hypothetical protein HYU41_22880 [Candidatus Rokubacteria bacterium]|nr:hypothetical protein [Candidatus Rokubacteria bacterium]